MVSLGALGGEGSLCCPHSSSLPPSLLTWWMLGQHWALGGYRRWYLPTRLCGGMGHHCLHALVGLETPMAVWHRGGTGPDTRPLPEDVMWLVLAANAEGQRNKEGRSGL